MFIFFHKILAQQMKTDYFNTNKSLVPYWSEPNVIGYWIKWIKIVHGSHFKKLLQDYWLQQFYTSSITYLMQVQPAIFATIRKFKQDHLIDHFKTLNDPHKQSQFLKQLQSVNYQQAAQLYHHVYLEKSALKEQEHQEFSPVTNVATHEDLQVHAEEYDKLGYMAIAKRQVAVCIMSGGQGTRLGFDHPKGMFDLGLKSQLTLFGFFANRLKRLSDLVKHSTGVNYAGCLIKWYLMTSEMNHDQIVGYFKQNNYFGYDQKSIVFFPQGGLPALFYDGKIIIESEGNLSLAPGGNGAIYSEMKSRGVLQHMKDNNVKYIYLGPVDNVLLKLGDPTSLGYLLKNNFDIVSHYLKKRSADEKVGLHLKVNNKVKILEYSETDQKVKQSKNQKGQFVYSHGARASMYVTRDFIEHLTSDPAVMLSINKKYHLAEKKIKHWDSALGKVVSAEKNNGVKFELFYFDVFQETDKIGLFQTIRQEEFAPLKNATGDDSPDSARQYLKRLHRKWLIDSGVELEGEGDVEVHPRVSYNGQGLGQWVELTNGELKAKLPLFISDIIS